ncbi:hypothetical protein B0A49_00520 [Cryomyces minteri]|uniref:Protein kinase domain-containing protein n=1 Tax=Cryomyces minteri TaxID=331657 RepID=A0A4U0XV48_9PEZI|nr:hypothetical protein B0A49_00520 [Cryomyces minteri]
MPQLLPFASNDDYDCGALEPPRVIPFDHQSSKPNMWGRLPFHKLGNWRKKEEEELPVDDLHGQSPEKPKNGLRRPSLLGRRLSRKAVPGLPRPQTFKRQDSEKRERLKPVEPSIVERRAVSVDRRLSSIGRLRSPPPIAPESLSAPEVSTSGAFTRLSPVKEQSGRTEGRVAASGDVPGDLPPGQPPPCNTTGPPTDHDDGLSDGPDDNLLQELDAKWILNLSMHFRDKSNREKFFVTYAEEPNKWRRVTVSCDYRDVPLDSLEADLKSLHYQRDKSARIYEAIRDSLGDIEFYPTVTNLKLQTSDGRLHLHVTEDVNEIIHYPSVSTVQHLDCKHYKESSLRFESHLSGFVYKVRVDGEVMIKKEIPGPDTIDEFLYEINALNSLTLSRAKSVISLRGVIVDDKETLVKGLLISFATRGPMVDLIYDSNTQCQSIPWARRERWAIQIVQGLSEIHEAGFVQGDFTLSNIVVDENHDAKIIDINRRGCPVGWEPPELAALIECGQRVSMHIGVKSDMFQLGMVLWALADELDEPERQERPFSPMLDQVPPYYRQIVQSCLSEAPQNRKSAKELLGLFPDVESVQVVGPTASWQSLSTHRSDKEYIDPATAVDLEDIDQYRRSRAGTNQSHFTSGQATSADMPTSTSGDYGFDSSGSYIQFSADS